MRKYFASDTTALSALFFLLLFVLLNILALILLLRDGPIFPTALFSVLFVVGISGSVILLWLNRWFFLAWGYFGSDAFRVFVPFQKEVLFMYQDCKDCGIGVYRHRELLFPRRYYKDVYYIFFSLEPFEESYRLRMNEWKASPNTIKISFDRELYQFLLTVLPHGYTWRLEHDYDYYVMNQSYLIQKNDLLRPNKKGKKRARKMKDGK